MTKRKITAHRKLSQVRLRDMMRHVPATGELIWKIFKINSNTKIGDRVGSIQKSTGYRRVMIDGKEYYTHALIVLYVTGKLPKYRVGHKNGDRGDDSLHNLYNLTKSGIGKSKSKNSKNTSGYTGVSWDKATSKWRASITCKGEREYIGSYVDKSDAIDARKTVEKKYGFNPFRNDEFDTGNSDGGIDDDDDNEWETDEW